MGRALRMRYDRQFDTLTLMLEEYWARPRSERPGTAHEVDTYPFLLDLLMDLGTDEVVGFCTEGVEFSVEYPNIVAAIRDRPWAERFDVPQLGLVDATLDEILDAIHRRFVLRERVIEYPTAEERERPLRAVAEG